MRAHRDDVAESASLDVVSSASHENERVVPANLTEQAVSAGFGWVLALSAALAVLIFGILVAMAGPWDLVAATRVLDLLIEGGIIKYHDLNPGFIWGLPDPKYYLMAQTPIDWRLVGVAAIFMMLYPSLKAVQFDRIARLYGSTATFGDHVRAYFYGDGLDRFLPLNMGRVATATIMTKHGLTPERAAGAAFVSQVFTVFEIAVFAIIGLSLLGWTEWLSQIFWALAFLGVAYFLVRRRAEMSVVPPVGVALRAAVQTFATLAQRRPAFLIQLCLLSIAAFGMLDLAVYTIMNAFHAGVVLLYVEPATLLMGIVGGYIAARLIPVTPGGIGQWELGFATGLYLGGANVSIALVTIALLAHVLRIVTGLLLMGIAVGRYGVPTNLQEVTSVFLRRPRPALAWGQADEDEDGPTRISVA